MRAALLTGLLLLAFVGSSGAQEAPLLVGTVGPGFTIDLADANGRHVDARASDSPPPRSSSSVT
jgi:hypothetical protein